MSVSTSDRLLRRRALGSEAVYRLIDSRVRPWRRTPVLVQVVAAPGLPAGMLVRIAARDARAMLAAA